MAGAAFLGFCFVALAGVWHAETSWLAAAVLSAAVAIPVLEVAPKARRTAAELGALALTAAVQRAAILSWMGESGYNYPQADGLPDPFLTAQWYVVLGAELGVLRYRSGHTDAGKLYLGLASRLPSLTGLLISAGTVPSSSVCWPSSRRCSWPA